MQGEGLGGGGVLPHFLKKKNRKEKKYTFSNKRNLWWNKNIRLADLAEASKFMIGPFRSYLSYGDPQNGYLSKTQGHLACSRLSDSGEDAKVKGTRKGWRGEKGEKEGRESP